MRRRIRFRVLSKLPRVSLLVDRLERRDLLSTVQRVPSVAGLVAHPMFDVAPLVANTSPPPDAYTPGRIQTAYGFNKITFGSVKGDGTGQTIAIVDAQDDPNIQADLNAFDTQFG